MLDRMYKEYEPEEAPQAMRQISEALDSADGFIIVTAEYNHSIPAALKNLLDHFQAEYFYKPSAIVTYSAGPFGGVRALINMRAILAELGSPSIPTTMPVSRINEAFDTQGNAVERAYVDRAGRMLAEFEWYSRALKRERELGLP
jgi:NAD(P)H-dependent FMN reductase